METKRPRGSCVPGAITVPQFVEQVPGVVHAFGTRASSKFSRVSSAGVKLEPVSVKQVHGTEILLIQNGMDADEIKQAAAAQGYDAIVTDRPQTFVTVRTADCVPILLLDPARRIVAAVHAGWRGTVGLIAEKAVQMMHRRLGCNLSTIRAVIGPSIGTCCYEVDEAVLAPLKRACSYWSEFVTHTRPGYAQLDLRRLNHRQLEETGLKGAHIAMVDLCTACHPDLFYSYRRDGQGTRHMVSGVALF